MKKAWRIFWAGAAAAAAVFAAGCAAENAVVREAQDRAQIEKLMWQYARALDTGNAEAYAATFAEDGQFGRGDNATKGRDALLAMMGAFRKSPPEGSTENPQVRQMYHMTANHWIEFLDRDHAVVHGYWFTYVSAGGQGAQPSIAGVGREVNELVRVDGQWLIQVRDVSPQD